MHGSSDLGGGRPPSGVTETIGIPSCMHLHRKGRAISSTGRQRAAIVGLVGLILAGSGRWQANSTGDEPGAGRPRNRGTHRPESVVSVARWSLAPARTVEAEPTSKPRWKTWSILTSGNAAGQV